MTACPTGCGRKQGAGKLLCLSCWLEVPKHLQRDVYRTWRAASNASMMDIDGWRSAWADYRRARDAAIASVR